jgi:hypothetical protein
MIAVLDARPGLAAASPAASPSPPTRPATYPAASTSTVYASAAAFAEHLQTQPAHDFIASVPALSTARPGSVVQLDEITLG